MKKDLPAIQIGLNFLIFSCECTYNFLQLSQQVHAKGRIQKYPTLSLNSIPYFKTLENS